MRRADDIIGRLDDAIAELSPTCQCGKPKVERNGAIWCPHCDELHPDLAVCGPCRQLHKSSGTGPGSDRKRVS